MPMKETDLAAAVVRYLTEEGWDVFPEVRGQDGLNVADIAATRGPAESMIVECKIARGWPVVAQAIRWHHQATMVYVAVPEIRSEEGPRWLGRLHENGLGQFVVRADGEVSQTVSPVRRKVDGLGIRASLKEEQKTYKAGNAEGSRFSPTDILREAFLAVAKPGDRVIDLAENGDQAATLRRLIKNGAIKGWEVRHGGKVYPVGYDRHSVSRSTTQGEG